MFDIGLLKSCQVHRILKIFLHDTIVNPNIQHYKENMDTENVKVRQLMVDTFTDGTKELSFDLVKNKKQRVTIEGCDYEIELMNIGKENIQGQIFPVFEFNVSKV